MVSCTAAIFFTIFASVRMRLVEKSPLATPVGRSTWASIGINLIKCNHPGSQEWHYFRFLLSRRNQPEVAADLIERWDLTSAITIAQLYCERDMHPLTPTYTNASNYLTFAWKTSFPHKIRYSRTHTITAQTALIRRARTFRHYAFL